MPIKSGNTYRGDLIEESIDQLTAIAGISGYAFVDVIPRISANPDTGKIDVIFAMDEGPRVYIERINIIGNTLTLDNVIRRRLDVSEGDAFNRVFLDRSRNRVRALGYFGEVEVIERPGSEPDRTVVDFQVEEQPTGELALAAGFSSVDAFLFDVSVSQRNLLGRGQTAIARISASQRNQTIDLQYQEPQFLGRNLAAGISIFGRRSDFSDVSLFETQTFGGTINVGFPLTRRSQLGLRYQISQQELDVADQDIVIDALGNLALTDLLDPDTGDIVIDPDTGEVLQTVVLPTTTPLPDGTTIVDQCDEAFIQRQVSCFSESNELTSLLGYTLQWDARNDPIAPTGGFDFSLSQDIAGLGGDVRFLRTTATGAAYKGLFPGVRASLRLSAGNIFAFGGGEQLRINNRFFRGGNDFRGFNVAGIGPRQTQATFDAEGNQVGDIVRGPALGGEVFYQGTLEVTLPDVIPEQYGIRGALFVEAGGLGVLGDEFDTTASVVSVANPDPDSEDPFTVITQIEDGLQLRASAGLSVFWDSPFGPIRFDFSQLITAPDFDRPRGIRFSTNTRF